VLIGATSVVAILSVLGGAGQAGVLRVPEDYSSVLAAVDAAASGDSILVGPGTWLDKEARIVLIGGSPKTFTSCGFLKGGVTVLGVGADATIIDAGASGSGFVTPFVFANYPGEEATLERLTIAGAANFGTGAFADNAGRLVIRACRLNGMTNPGPQGAGLALDRCGLLLEDSEVSFNTSTAVAGVYAVFSDIQILRCRFEGNQGACVQAFGSPNGPRETAQILDCDFVENQGGVGLNDFYSVTVERSRFVRNVIVGGGGTLLVRGTCFGSAFGSIRENVFAYDSTAAGIYGSTAPAGLDAGCFYGPISNNTFVGCHLDGGGDGAAVVAGNLGSQVVQFDHNLITGSTGGGGAYLLGTVVGSCNAFWDNEGGNGVYTPFPTDLFLDPLFCDLPNLDFTLDAHSPYAPGNNPTCGQIGALGVGCGSVAVKAMTWGRVKTLYR
jgi:hypothetical protein